MIKAIEALSDPKLRPMSAEAIPQWLIQIAYRYLVDRHRRDTTLRNDRRRNCGDARLGDVPAPGPTASKVARGIELLSWLKRELSSSSFTIINMLIKCHTYEDIAQETGKSAGAIGVKIHRIRAWLRRRLAGRPAPDPGRPRSSTPRPWPSAS